MVDVLNVQILLNHPVVDASKLSLGDQGQRVISGWALYHADMEYNGREICLTFIMDLDDDHIILLASKILVEPDLVHNVSIVPGEVRLDEHAVASGAVLTISFPTTHEIVHIGAAFNVLPAAFVADYVSSSDNVIFPNGITSIIVPSSDSGVWVRTANKVGKYLDEVNQLL